MIINMKMIVKLYQVSEFRYDGMPRKGMLFVSTIFIVKNTDDKNHFEVDFFLNFLKWLFIIQFKIQSDLFVMVTVVRIRIIFDLSLLFTVIIVIIITEKETHTKNEKEQNIEKTQLLLQNKRKTNVSFFSGLKKNR